MPNDHNPPMIGPPIMLDPATYKPRSGKAVFMNELTAELEGKPKALAATIVGNCTRPLSMKFKFDANDNGHTLIVGSPGNGMSARLDAAQDQYVEAGGTVKVSDKGPTSKR